MKKIIFLILILSACCRTALATVPLAQASGAHNGCDIVITGSFDSECVYDYKDAITDEYPNLMIACKQSIVTYTAWTATGSATVTSCTWEVYGDVSHTASGNQVTVTWGDDDWGVVVVTVTTTAGDTCTESSRVRLIDKPTASSVTVPAYTVLPGGRKVVRVCEGGTVQFIDQSASAGSDLAGHHWECKQRSPSSTPNYTIENVTMNDFVQHRVYNNCGCYDEEEIEIEVVTGVPLELECYGAVCEDAIVEYHVVSPACHTYQWYVEGGTLIDGRGTDRPVVQWDHPEGGYGVIGLDGVLCDDQACPTLTSLTVPVIQDSLAIEGPSEACLGEAVVYRLPLLGSTKYSWSITPTTGVDTSMKTSGNELRLVFNQPGVYELRCSYRCDFLDCGPYAAQPLTIRVKPVLSIAGDDHICLTNACHLATAPAVTADWAVYDLGAGNQVAATATGSSTFVHTFSDTGRYLVTAVHDSFCGPATFVLTVNDVPAAPTAGDLAPGNRHVACPWQGVTLRGTPAEPRYSLVWMPVDTTALPQQHSGDSVAISYQGAVCDVRVYHYDRQQQCLSTGYYVHQMAPLVPAPLNIPTHLTVCPGSLLVWGSDKVPDQSADGMLYEWKIQPDRQSCASVQGSHLTPGIALAVNNIPTPATFYVELVRSFCDGSVSDYIYLHVVDSSSNPLAISGPDSVCQHSPALYTGSGAPAGDYRWTYRNHVYQGDSVTVTFDYAGTEQLFLRANPYDYCTNENLWPVAVKTVTVKPQPPVLGLKKIQLSSIYWITVYPTPTGSGYSYQWEYQADAYTLPTPLTGTVRVPYTGEGIYRCTVTKNGCSKTMEWNSSIEMAGVATCDTLEVSHTYNPCNKTLMFNTPGNLLLIWTIHCNGQELTPDILGINGHNACISVDEVGIYNYYVEQLTGFCNKASLGAVYIRAIPDITLEKACNEIILHNRSKYADGSTLLHISVSNSCNSTVDTIELPAGTATRTYTPFMPGFLLTPCTYTFTLTGIGDDSDVEPCTLGSITLPALRPHPIGFNPVTITSANAANINHTCDNTPIQLTATLNTPGQIVSSNWSFGDGSSYETSGNSIYHTFGYNVPNTYSVSVTITDTNKCTKTSKVPLNITSHPNDLDNTRLDYQQIPLFCPNTNPKNLSHIGGNIAYDYYWYAPRSTTPTFNHSIVYPTYYQGDYGLYVENSHYCKKELSKYVKFLCSPSAIIYAERFTCCVGDKLKLYGQQGPDGEPLAYHWTVSDPVGNIQTYTTPNIVFTAPNNPGAYTVTLTVTNTQTTCSSTATETVTVTTPPAAPTITAVGSPCISDAPVRLAATGYTGEVHWSNGETGATADYYTHGLASAYYFDPAVGCPSAAGKYRIERQPDFDALLTGCYRKCSQFFDYNLPLYSFTTDMQSISWDWRRNGTTLASGSGNYTYVPLLLPLVGAGDYQMLVDYAGGACSEASPTLSIEGKKLCDCDSIDITYTTEAEIRACRIVYDVKVTICNHYADKVFCAEKLEQLNHTGDGTGFITNLTPTTIAPGECITFNIRITAESIIPSAISFMLTDEQCADCEKTFSIDLPPIATGCEERMQALWLKVNTSLTNPVAAYIRFRALVSPAQHVLSFWSDPPMVMDYIYNGIDLVNGLLMIDMAILAQRVAQDSAICFYALVCNRDTLCLRKACIPAQELLSLIANAGAKEEGNTKGGSVREGTTSPANGDALSLQPNPTTGHVVLTGPTDGIVEVTVMDMLGRHIASFGKTARLNVADLASGSYIVRVMQKRDAGDAAKLTYLRLIKK